MASVSERTERLLADQFDAIRRHTDRLFAALMPIQWIASTLAVLYCAPTTVSGGRDYRAVWPAILAGACITLVPVCLALRHPGRASTRQVMAVAQISWSALLIQFTGGQTGGQFHVFGSLAVLACYRDWRVLATATAVVACEQALRGVAGSVPTFTTLETQLVPTVEYFAWVAFELGFLLVSMRQSVREMSRIARQQARLEETNQMQKLEFGQRVADFKTTPTAWSLHVVRWRNRLAPWSGSPWSCRKPMPARSRPIGPKASSWPM